MPCREKGLRFQIFMLKGSLLNSQMGFIERAPSQHIAQCVGFWVHLSFAPSAPSLKAGCEVQEAPFYSLGSPSLAQDSCRGRDLVNVV